MNINKLRESYYIPIYNLLNKCEMRFGIKSRNKAYYYKNFILFYLHYNEDKTLSSVSFQKTFYYFKDLLSGYDKLDVELVVMNVFNNKLF